MYVVHVRRATASLPVCAPFRARSFFSPNTPSPRQNEPLYFKTFVGGAEYLRLQLGVFASLDVVEEKLALRRSGRVAEGAKDSFLGMLMPVEEFKVFGYVTSTNVKLLLVVRDVLLREDRLRDTFKAVHRLYADAISNPFAPTDGALAAPMFEEAMTRTLDSAASSIVYSGPLPL